jgi:hypothetical protein
MTPAERAARERKQKIFVAVGGLLLVGLLAIQLPKLLGGSSGASSSSSTTTDASASPSTPGATSAVAGRSIVARLGVTSFSRFGGKDPFVQQVKFSEGSTPSSGTSGKSGGESKGSGKKSSSKPSTQKFTTGSQPTASMTVISVNGARQALSAGSRFPAADPVFVLVSEDQKKKSVVVGVAGGAYTSGSRTTKLVVGKPLVLVNTTTGARYKLVLVAVGNGESAATKSGSDQKSGAGTTPATPTTPSAP